MSEALEPLGVGVGVGVGGDVDPTAVERDGQCRLWWGRAPLDLFFAYDELHEAMRRDARTVPFGDARIVILAPEHLVVCKAAFDRPKDWLDIEQVLVCTEDLEVEAIRAWLDRIVGANDQRAERFGALVKRTLE